MLIYVLEDDPLYGAMLAHYIALNPEFRVALYDTVEAYRQALAQVVPDVLTVDFGLPDGDARQVVMQLQQAHPQVKVVVISGQKDVDMAVSLVKLGVEDYLVKDEHTQEKLWLSLHKIYKSQQLQAENALLKQQLQARDEQNPDYGITGSSKAMEQVHVLIAKAAGSDINVVITGETGTGKELVARAIHKQSRRGQGPFVAVNVAAIPSELAESELFGHEKGAFTGALQRRQGRLEEAHGGSLFLDEIGEMPLGLQAKLLRVLQERSFQRVGSGTLVKSDFRLLVATHRQLPQMVQEGRFREDLFYRLQGLPIVLPPLRMRGHDIIFIARQCIDQYCQQHHLPEKTLSTSAARLLLTHQWPGNIRELKNAVELACVLADEKLIEPDHLISLQQNDAQQAGTHLTLRQHTAMLIQQHLNTHQNDVLKVARLLDIGKSTIYRMINNQELVLGKTAEDEN